MTLRRRAKYVLYNFVPGFAGRFPYCGSRVRFPTGAQLFRAICANGSFEPDVIDRLVKLAKPNTTVFDVGANLGLMAIPVLRDCADCRVVSFEPSPNSLPFLEQTARESVYANRWVIRGAALAGSPGERDFTVGRPGDALFEGFKSGKEIANALTIKVPVSTLDAEWIALGRPAVSAVKIDVEGAEWEVLAGARQVIGAQGPALLIEWHEPYLARFGTDAFSLLTFAEQFNYQVFTVPAGVAVRGRAALRVQMMSCQNFLLLPTEPQ